MSHNRKVLIACNACCNALVLYVTGEGSVGDVSGAQTLILTVCITIRDGYNRYLTSNNLKDFGPGVTEFNSTGPRRPEAAV